MSNNLGEQYSLPTSEYEKKAIERLPFQLYILGNEVRTFEKEWTEYTGFKFCVVLTSVLLCSASSLYVLEIQVKERLSKMKILFVTFKPMEAELDNELRDVFD